MEEMVWRCVGCRNRRYFLFTFILTKINKQRHEILKNSVLMLAVGLLPFCLCAWNEHSNSLFLYQFGYKTNLTYKVVEQGFVALQYVFVVMSWSTSLCLQ